METKICPKCVKKRPVNLFQIQRGQPHGYCEPCRCEYMKTYNENRYKSPKARAEELQRGRDKYHRVVKNQRMERKKELIRIMGGKCEWCHYDKSAAALDFDHIEPTSKNRTVSHLLAINKPWAWPLALEEAKKCRLLCSNCHRERTYPGHELNLPMPESLKPSDPCQPANPHNGTAETGESFLEPFPKQSEEKRDRLQDA